ncbi:MAG: FAD/NAD(P)-binding protein [Pseudomonadota bacterium]|nr:FAD/NAD(P)-binding protein [Pseudomonadota bacterium]
MGNKETFDIAIIGGGAAGVLLALRLLRAGRSGQRIALIEPGQPGRGVAYGTDDPAHVLNVPAGNMSADADNPDDFIEFLRARDGQADPTSYRPRRDYADYLHARLAQAVAASAVQFRHISQQATRLQRDGQSCSIELGDGEKITTQKTVLATGNHPRMFAADTNHARIISAWDADALTRIGLDDEIVILGSGLSMVDVVLSLDARGHRGTVSVVSRHGLLPLAHPAHKQKLDFDSHALQAMPLGQRLSVLRKTAATAAADGIGWQALMDALRHHVRELWQSLDGRDQQRFLRHAVRLWDVHRHRIAPAVAAQLQARIDAGRLQVRAARVLETHSTDSAITLRLQPRHQDQSCTLQADWLVNATGIETRTSGFDDPLLCRLMADGLARPGPHDLGFDCTADATVLDGNGKPQPWLAAIGSLRLGNLWESTAIPDLRLDAAALARRLLN